MSITINRVCYAKDLAGYYGVDAKTFRAWMKRHPQLQNIRPIPGSKYYSVQDVKTIIECLGETTKD